MLNAGSNGWATANESVYLAKEGVRFKPGRGDRGASTWATTSRTTTAECATVQDAVEADLALRGADSFEGPRRILRKSELYTVFESGVLAKLPWWQDDGGSDSVRPTPPRTLAEAQEAWTITERLLDRMRDVSQSQGARFMVMVVPSATAVAQRGGTAVKETDDDEDESGEDEASPASRIRTAPSQSITARNNLTTLDLLRPMRRADNRIKERLYYRQNAHWTAAGHGCRPPRSSTTSWSSGPDDAVSRQGRALEMARVGAAADAVAKL